MTSSVDLSLSTDSVSVSVSSDICDYKSNWMQNMTSHKDTKHEESVYMCELCNYTNNWKKRYSEHRREIHGVYEKALIHKADMKQKESMCEDCGFVSKTKRVNETPH
jgi:hypothetical protein